MLISGLDNIHVLHNVSISLACSIDGLGECCAYPVTARRLDGLIVCAYRCGSETHTYDGIAVARTSRDHGKTWSDSTILYNGLNLNPPETVLNN